MFSYLPKSAGISSAPIAPYAASDGRGLRVGLFSVDVRRQDVLRHIVGELAPRGGRQDHEVGVLPFGEAAQDRVQEGSIGSRYRMPARETTNSVVSSTDKLLRFVKSDTEISTSGVS